MFSDKDKKIMDTPEFKEIKESVLLYGAPAMFEKYISMHLKKSRDVEYNRDALGAYLQGILDALSHLIDDREGVRTLMAGYEVGEKLWKDKYEVKK